MRALHAFSAVHANQEAFDHAQRALEVWPRVTAAAALTGLDDASLLAETARFASATGHSVGPWRWPSARSRSSIRALIAIAALTSSSTPSGSRGRRADSSRPRQPRRRPTDHPRRAAKPSQGGGDRDPRRRSMVPGPDRRIGESQRGGDGRRGRDGDRRTWSLAAASYAHSLADSGAAARAASMVERLETIGQEPDGTDEGVAATSIDPRRRGWPAASKTPRRSRSPGSTNRTAMAGTCARGGRSGTTWPNRLIESVGMTMP